MAASLHTLAAAAAKATTPRVAVVIVHYRGAADTKQCVASVRATAAGTPIVLVDNASPDGSAAELRAAFADAEDVELLASPRNGGFGAGCNLGLERALAICPQAPAVLLLNPDARLRPGALAAMLDLLRRQPEAGIVGCRIVDGLGDRVWFANGRIPSLTLSGFHCAPPPGQREHRAAFVTGAAMLVAADLLHAGLRFDERFFLYAEDVDLSLRVRAAGRGIWITQDAIVEHRGGGSQAAPPVLGQLTAEQVYWLARSKVLLAKKHLGWLRRCVFYAFALLAKPLAGWYVAGNLGFLRPYLAGLRAGLAAADGTDPGCGSER
jgi:hypothetical protein